MHRRVGTIMRVLTIAVCLPMLVSAQDPREIVRHSVALDQRNSEIARNYTYLERQEQRELDAKGNVKDTDSHTWDVTWHEDRRRPYRRLVAHNDKPLSPAEQKKEDEQKRKSLERRTQETPEQRQSRLAEQKHRREQERPFAELPDAFDFKLVGEEALNGGQTYVIDATPRPGYKPKTREAAIFPKVKARFWIDKNDYQWVKVEADIMDTITFGGILIRMSKGGHFTMENARINNEVWLPKRIAGKGQIRIALVKVLRGEMIITYSDYKKFQADSHVITTGQ
jgi:hypothetical protein